MIGIIGAMEIETSGFVARLDNTSTQSVGSYLFTVGELYGKKVVVCRCGIGKVFSSTAAALMIEKFAVKCIINLGVAGGATEVVTAAVLAVNSVPRMGQVHLLPLGGQCGRNFVLLIEHPTGVDIDHLSQWNFLLF